MFGQKARKINELQAMLTGKDIDLRAALSTRVTAEALAKGAAASFETAKREEEIAKSHAADWEAKWKESRSALDRMAGLTAERDQLSARVEELEQEVARLKGNSEGARLLREYPEIDSGSNEPGR